ncbi:MAG: ATP-binding protein [Planctomycetia bacterium]|nr:ATP-binding protein [Planctomycetia bacterium]
MFFEKFNQARRTLRFRLMAWNAFVIVLTASVTLLGLRAGVRLAIVNEIDGVLIEDVREIEFALDDAGATAEGIRAAATSGATGQVAALLATLERKDRGHEQHGWFAQLFDGEGNLVWASEHAPTEVSALLRTRDMTPTNVSDFRVVQNRRKSNENSLLLVQVGSLSTFVARDMARIDRLVAICVGFVLVLGPAIGYWLAGRAIDPLAEIIHTTARLRPTKLDERLVEHRTGDELDQLARTINGFLNRIAAYLEKRRDFLANAAHELRTPLAAIRSTAEVSLGAERSVEEYQELLVEVIDECSLLESLVNQLLLLAETESDRLRIHGERVDLSSVAAKAVGMFQAVAETKDIVFSAKLEPELTVEGNSHHLRQVVNNLIDNALKFTPAGGQVTVRLRAEHEHVIFAVRDSGPGIPEADLPQIFERFFRGDRSHSHEGERRGTGLGLSICQAVVQAHGGDIAVETQAGRGATFIVRIPLAPVLVDRGEAAVNDGNAALASKPTDTA